MSLERKAERWVAAKIIDDKTKALILEFELKWRAARVSLYLNLLGVPLLAIGAITACVVAYVNMGDYLGFALDLMATSTLAIGTFHVILKKVAPKSKSLRMGMGNFALGSVLLIAGIAFENLSPYRSLLIWASFILFSSLLAQRLFKWLTGLTVVYMGLLWGLKQLVGENPDFDPYLAVAFIMAALTPVFIFSVWFWRFSRRLWQVFWQSAALRQLMAFLQTELVRIKATWRLFLIRRRATKIWMGRLRFILIECLGGLVLGCMLRKHFEFLDVFLWESQSIYTYGTLAAWVVLLTLLPKEKHRFSMWFTALGSLATFLELGQFNRQEGFILSTAGTHFHLGHMTLGIVVLITASHYARKFCENKITASNIFQLGPLGWTTAVGLLSLV